MSGYQTLPGLAEVYLEDSFVVGIHGDGGTLSFDLDAVLTERHPRFAPPSPDEQYCYVSASLTFSHADAIDWLSRTDAAYRDANDEVDYGNIDFLTVEGSTYHLGGDWGEVIIRSSTPPEFRIHQ
jgi:hypothetical protein